MASNIVIYYIVYTNTRKQRDNERRHYENELRTKEETIAVLQDQNLELTRLNEYLKRLKVKPQKLINDVAEVINSVTSVVNQLKEYNTSLDETGYIIINPDKLTKYQLKSNEKLVLEEIIAGKTFQEIADTVHLAEGTVKNIASKLYEKFEVKNKDELIKFIIENVLNDKD